MTPGRLRNCSVYTTDSGGASTTNRSSNHSRTSSDGGGPQSDRSYDSLLEVPECVPPFSPLSPVWSPHASTPRSSTIFHGQFSRANTSGCFRDVHPPHDPQTTRTRREIFQSCCFNPGRSIVWRCLPHGCIVRRLCADWCGAGRNRCSGVWGGRVSRDAIPPCLAMSSRTPLQKWQSAVKSISTTRVRNMLLRNVLSLRVRPASAPAALAFAHCPEVTSSATLLFAERGIYPT